MKRIHAAALTAVLFGAIPGQAQQPPTSSDVMTLTVTDGKPHICKILRTSKHADGSIVYDVRDQITGEEMTVVENAKPDDVKAAAKTEPKPETKPEPVTLPDPILAPKDYSAAKVQDLYGVTPITVPTTQYSQPPVPAPAPRRWFNWFRNDPPAPKPVPQQSSRIAVPPAETIALYHPDPVIRLIGSLSDDLLPSMREVSAETLARNAKDRPEVVQAMIRSVQTDPAASVRVCCCRCLVEMQIRTPECISALKSLEDDREESVQKAAAAALSVLDVE